MITFIIYFISIVFILIGIISFGINMEVIRKLLSSIKIIYKRVWKDLKKIEKIIYIIFGVFFLVIIGLSSYVVAYQKYNGDFTLNALGYTIFLFVVSSILIFLIFGIPFLIMTMIIEYLVNMKNSRASKMLTASVILTSMYSFFLFLEKENMVNHYKIVFIGIIITYILNINILLNITINPFYLISSNEGSRKSAKNKKIFSLFFEETENDTSNQGKGDNEKVLQYVWIGAIILIVLLIINLLLGVLMIYDMDSSAYVCTSNSSYNGFSIFDLFYYTIITFTTIGYGDIVPNSPASKVMAIIISITSVICLTIFLSSILSAKINPKRKSKSRINAMVMQRIQILSKKVDEIYEFDKIFENKLCTHLESMKIENKINKSILDSMINELDIIKFTIDGQVLNISKIHKHINDIKINVLRVSDVESKLVNNIEEKIKSILLKLNVEEQIKFLSNRLEENAEKTKLLALNASIEVAKIGGIGKGLGVIVEEIKNVSAESKDMKTEFEEIKNAISNSLNDMSESLDKIGTYSKENVHNDMILNYLKVYDNEIYNCGKLLEQCCSQIERIQDMIKKCEHDFDKNCNMPYA